MAVRLQKETRRGRPKRYGFRSTDEGRRMRYIKGARRAHASMRAQGRVPGDEGRAVIEANRVTRTRQANSAASRESEMRAVIPARESCDYRLKDDRSDTHVTTWDGI